MGGSSPLSKNICYRATNLLVARLSIWFYFLNFAAVKQVKGKVSFDEKH